MTGGVFGSNSGRGSQARLRDRDVHEDDHSMTSANNSTHGSSAKAAWAIDFTEASGRYSARLVVLYVKCEVDAPPLFMHQPAQSGLVAVCRFMNEK